MGGRHEDAKRAVEQARKERDELRDKGDKATKNVDKLTNALIRDFEEMNGLRP